MGTFDSSLTRVQPVFTELYNKDMTGKQWLGRLLQLPQQRSASIIPENLGCLDQPPVFELPADPSRLFLKWLLEHPEELSVPDQKVWQKWNEQTRHNREALLRRDNAICNQAITELDRYDRLPARVWWRLEGISRVDCALTTPTTVVFIEGKRTEIGASKAVQWYPHRNQVLRNLECVDYAIWDLVQVLFEIAQTASARAKQETDHQRADATYADGRSY